MSGHHDVTYRLDFRACGKRGRKHIAHPPLPDAEAVFAEWQAKPDKVKY